MTTEVSGVKWEACEWSGVGANGTYGKIWLREARTPAAAEAKPMPFGWGVFTPEGHALHSKAVGEAFTWKEAAEKVALAIAAATKVKP